MRTGKTYIIISHLTAVAPLGPHLIVAPLSVLSTWEDELARFGIRDGVFTFRGNGLDVLGSHAFTLVNYEQMRGRLSKELAAVPWSSVTLDESTYIKNPRAIVTRALLGPFDHVQRRFILTGLPDPESRMDLFTQMRFCYGSFMGEKNYYHWRYRHFTQDDYTWTMLKRSRAMMEAELKERAYVLVREDIPAFKKATKRRVRVYCELPAKRRKQYDGLLKDFQRATYYGTHLIGVMRWLHQFASGCLPGFSCKHKLNALAEYLAKCEIPKAVVWCCYREEIAALEDRLQHLGKTAVIHGGTSRGLRRLRQRSFNRGSTRFLVCQVKCARFGLDFSRGTDTFVYYSRDFSLESNLQSEERGIHPKRPRQITIVNMVTRNTIDEHVLSLLGTKRLSTVTLRAALRRVGK
jgi:SNF2 family DNA or RNA helicase